VRSTTGHGTGCETETFWFVAVALMLTVYVVLDGFDLGAGIIHHVAAKTEAERRGILRAIGPVWDGNEVWLMTVFIAQFLPCRVRVDTLASTP
jgi:cytochrome bd-type quinol oxidase subunit 2